MTLTRDALRTLSLHDWPGNVRELRHVMELCAHTIDGALLDTAGLTGVFNRRHFDERLEAELSYAVRHKGELCLLLLDIDLLKRVNDGHGHLAGDEVLRAVATLLERTMRREDLVARYGGEESVVLARGSACPRPSCWPSGCAGR